MTRNHVNIIIESVVVAIILGIISYIIGNAWINLIPFLIFVVYWFYYKSYGKEASRFFKIDCYAGIGILTALTIIPYLKGLDATALLAVVAFMEAHDIYYEHVQNNTQNYDFS